ncbi:unnamed protein product [Cylindrotheca closterium]|uniref:PITH domain-containing protein n=1 Tax=Cylindrotheca closterium TaxID=2856 RepID=A0AAD2FLC4_9STRA|nr:unnamed protein product [Cylindrotheca closterium]
MSNIAGLNDPPTVLPIDSKEDGKLIDLSTLMEKNECFCRNEDPSFPYTNLFIGDSILGCKSDADEQMILHIAFRETVRVKSIKFKAFNEGNNPELNPTVIKMYVNRNNLGFEDIEDVDPTQVIELTAKDLEATSDPINTKFVKFQRVGSITFFIEENNGGEVSALGGLHIIGKGLASMNVNELKKQPGA